MSSVLIRILRKVTLVPGPSVSLVLLFDGDNLGQCPICGPPPLSEGGQKSGNHQGSEVGF